MINFKNLIKRILRKLGMALDKEAIEKKNNILTLADKKLISAIGMETHCFYYPEKSQVRDRGYLKNLVKEAERRNLGGSENVKGAKAFLEEFRAPSKVAANETLNSAESFFELAKKRQSIREFSEKKIPNETIYQILKCAIEAPSSCNRQTWRFLILNNEKSLSFISKIRRIAFLKNAAVVICVLADKDLYLNNQELGYTIYMDGAAAIMNILYAAESLGVSSCWVNFGRLEIAKADMDEFYKFFNISQNFEPLSLVALGYGAQKVKKPKREPMDYYMIGAGNKNI